MCLTPFSPQGAHWDPEDLFCISLGQEGGREMLASCTVRRGRGPTCTAKIKGSWPQPGAAKWFPCKALGQGGWKTLAPEKRLAHPEEPGPKIHGYCRYLRRSASCPGLSPQWPQEGLPVSRRGLPGWAKLFPSGVNFLCLEIRRSPGIWWLLSLSINPEITAGWPIVTSRLE